MIVTNMVIMKTTMNITATSINRIPVVFAYIPPVTTEFPATKDIVANMII